MPKEVNFNALYAGAMTAKTAPEADRWVKVITYMIATLDPNKAGRALYIVKNSIGYLSGYQSSAERDRIEQLYGTAHPLFGSVADNGEPTPEQAFALGLQWAESLKNISNESQQS